MKILAITGRDLKRRGKNHAMKSYAEGRATERNDCQKKRVSDHAEGMSQGGDQPMQ